MEVLRDCQPAPFSGLFQNQLRHAASGGGETRERVDGAWSEACLLGERRPDHNPGRAGRFHRGESPENTCPHYSFHPALLCDALVARASYVGRVGSTECRPTKTREPRLGFRHSPDSTEQAGGFSIGGVRLRSSPMKRKQETGGGPPSPPRVERWARSLATAVNQVMARFPEADPEDVRRTLICLQSSPLERLNRSLRRGRGFAAFRK